MKCEACQALIAEFFDGELDKVRAAEVSAHIDNCISCASLGAEMSREHEVYSLYERDVDVTPGLWMGVQAKIEEQRTSEQRGFRSVIERWFGIGTSSGWHAPRLSPAFGAALVIAAVAITIGVMSYIQSRDQRPTEITKETNPPASVQPHDTPPPKQPEQPTVVQNESGPTAPGGTERIAVKPRIPNRRNNDPDRLVREAEQKYLAAISLLSRDFKGQRERLDPETRTKFELALAQIDETVRATREAVRRNPGDPIALQYMLAAYSRKVDFLRDTAREDVGEGR